MNETITIDGKDYEVLTLDKIGEITHARLAGGKVVESINDEDDSYEIQLSDGSDFYLCKASFIDLGIQPLKLIERKPVSFVGEVVTVCQGSIDGVPGLHRLVEFTAPEDVWQKLEKGMKFRCVQITEEA